jgi:hypothetical protein
MTGPMPGIATGRWHASSSLRRWHHQLVGFLDLPKQVLDLLPQLVL